MVPALHPRRLFRESVPVAAVLLFWMALSWFGWHSVVTARVRDAGLVMALLYAVTRGVELGRSHPGAGVGAPAPDDAASAVDVSRRVLRENARVALPAGAWFVAALLVGVAESLWDATGLPGAFVSPANALSFVLAGAGVGVVVIYAVAVGTARIRDGRDVEPGRRPRGDAGGTDDTSDATPADD